MYPMDIFLEFELCSRLLHLFRQEIMGDSKIPRSWMTETCWEILVTCLRNVRDKSQKAICTFSWGYWITLYCIGTGPRQFCETSAKIANLVTIL